MKCPRCGSEMIVDAKYSDERRTNYICPECFLLQSTKHPKGEEH